LYIFRVSIETDLGTTAASRIVGLSSEGSGASRNSEAPRPGSEFLDEWHAEVNKVDAAFWGRRIAREHSVLEAVRDGNSARPLVQRTLFDRRAERAGERASSEQRELELSLQRRLAESKRLAALGPASAQLLLVLLP
jgi:hypothetical protein